MFKPNLLLAVAIGLLLLPPRPAPQKSPPPPRFVELKLAGMNLLHASASDLQRRFGHAETALTATGQAYRWRDPLASALLEFAVDEESGSIKSARVARIPLSPSRKISPSRSPAFRMPRPVTGSGLALGDPPSAVERAYGKPHRIERGKGNRMDYLYTAPMRPDGSLPAYRARYTFVNSKLDGLTIVIGE